MSFRETRGWSWSGHTVVLVAVLLLFSNISVSAQQPNLLEATWLSGSSDTNVDGIYGTRGLAEPANVPGARWGSAEWYDEANRELWLFGGYGIAGSARTLPFYATRPFLSGRAANSFSRPSHEIEQLYFTRRFL